jgi:porphobilinogen synthase
MADFFLPQRMRRNRKSQWVRDLVSESHLSRHDLIMPLFIVDGVNIQSLISTMPNTYRYSIDKLLDKCKSLYDNGIDKIMLFPCIDSGLKADNASEALNPTSIIYQAIRQIKQKIPNMGIIVDIALDPYTSHGHDGILNQAGEVDNDATVALLKQQTLITAEAGVDAVSPSDMMDGRIYEIRKTLEENHFKHINIIAYAAKYASSLYSPFRTALCNQNLGLNKKTYQMDFRNVSEAIMEVQLDIDEGADIIIIKPGIPYLDVLTKIKQQFNIPLLSYQVSGEYSMIMNAAIQEILDENQVMLEHLTAFKRAGANGIITYWADKATTVLS